MIGDGHLQWEWRNLVGSPSGFDARDRIKNELWMDGITMKTRKAEAGAGGEEESRSSVLVEILGRQLDIQTWS